MNPESANSIANPGKTMQRRRPILLERSPVRFQHRDADVVYRPDYLSQRDADWIFQQLQGPGISWRHDDITIFGRRVAQPRLTAWVADPGLSYRYSGLQLTPGKWTKPLQSLRDRLSTDLDVDFNSVLLNLYRDGEDAMGWHRDNEKQLGPNPTIASLSLGESRYFDLRHRCYRELDEPVRRFELQHGDLIVMSARTQHSWQHRVPRQRKQQASRINLSFRHTLPPDGSRPARSPRS